MWVTLASREVLWVYEMQIAATYIDRRKVEVAQWVTLHTILEVCTHEWGVEGGGWHMIPWWRQEVLH